MSVDKRTQLMLFNLREIITKWEKGLRQEAVENLFIAISKSVFADAVELLTERQIAGLSAIIDYGDKNFIGTNTDG